MNNEYNICWWMGKILFNVGIFLLKSRLSVFWYGLGNEHHYLQQSTDKLFILLSAKVEFFLSSDRCCFFVSAHFRPFHYQGSQYSITKTPIFHHRGPQYSITETPSIPSLRPSVIMKKCLCKMFIA